MKMPKVVNTYCPKCRKHTPHEVERVKARPRGERKQGQRRFRRIMAGYGSFPKASYEGMEKPTRRIFLRYRCNTCKKAHQRPCFRTKKFELAE